MVGCNVFRRLCTRQRRKASAAKKRKSARGAGRQQPEWEAVPVAPEIKALERTMDPILAPRAWNAKNSRLLQLPDEILIEILRTMGPRTPELFMMRRVCRKFRHLINAPDLRKYILSDKGCVHDPPPLHIHASPRPSPSPPPGGEAKRDVECAKKIEN